MNGAHLSTELAQTIALEYVKHRAWKLGTVHEVRVAVTLRGRQPLVLTFKPTITRRRDLQGRT